MRDFADSTQYSHDIKLIFEYIPYRQRNIVNQTTKGIFLNRNGVSVQKDTITKQDYPLLHIQMKKYDESDIKLSFNSVGNYTVYRKNRFKLDNVNEFDTQLIANNDLIYKIIDKFSYLISKDLNDLLYDLDENVDSNNSEHTVIFSDTLTLISYLELKEVWNELKEKELTTYYFLQVDDFEDHQLIIQYRGLSINDSLLYSEELTHPIGYADRELTKDEIELQNIEIQMVKDFIEQQKEIMENPQPMQQDMYEETKRIKCDSCKDEFCSLSICKHLNKL